MDLRHLDVLSLCINWCDIWKHISYNETLKKKCGNIVLMGCHGFHEFLLPFELMKTECQSLGGIFIEEFFFFFLWERVLVKYELFFLRTIYFTFLKYFRNSWSSAEGNIYSVISWGTLILNEWFFVSDLFLKETVERFSIYFYNFVCKWCDHILAIL